MKHLPVDTVFYHRVSQKSLRYHHESLKGLISQRPNDPDSFLPGHVQIRVGTNLQQVDVSLVR